MATIPVTKLRWGLIGCGDIARKRVAPALRDSTGCELVAVARHQAHLAESFANQFGAAKWYSNWEGLLDDAEIDAVYVATPVHLHESQAVAVAQSGKHVLCEKPMAMNVVECDRMIEACRANNVRLGIAYYRHFYPAILRMRSLIESGEIGTRIVAQVNAFEWFDPAADHPRAWLLKQKLAGGGPMFDFGCHRIEVLMHLFGEPKEIRGITSNALFTREVEDTATAIFRFASGACATLTVSHAANEPQDTLQVFGSAGSVHVASLNEGTLRIVTEKGERIEALPPAENLHKPLIEDFVTAVINNREPAVTGAIGRTVARIEQEIYGKSAHGSSGNQT